MPTSPEPAAPSNPTPESPSAGDLFEPLYLLEDEPVRSLETDHLGLRPFASVIAGAAIGTPGPFTIGVFAPWGEGKTSVLRLAKSMVDRRKEIDQAHVVTVWFNAWQFEREEHPIVPLLATIVDAVEERIAELVTQDVEVSKPAESKIRKGLAAVATALRAVAYGFSAKGKFKFLGFGEVEAGVSGKDAIERYDKLQAQRASPSTADDEESREPSDPRLPSSLYLNAFQRLEKVAQALAEESAGPSPKIAVFIDDLDRCLPPQGMALLESIKLVLGQPGFVFALAVDRRVLESYLLKRYEQDFGMKEYEQGSKLYLDKIVQLPLALPSHETRFENYLRDLLAKSPAFQGGRNAQVAEALKSLSPVLALGSESNPRNLVRFVNNLIVDFHLWRAVSPDETIDATLLELAAVSRMLQQHLGSFYRELSRDSELCLACADLEALAKREIAGREEGWGRERRVEELKRLLGQKRVVRDLLSSDAGKKWLADSAVRRKVDLFLVTQREKVTKEEQSQQEIIEKAIREALNLEPETPITDEHRGRVLRLELSLEGVTDAGLPALASLPALTSLDLGRTQITGAGLPALASLTALTSLDLRFTQITDAGLPALASLTALTSLGLRGTQITGAGLPALAGLTALTSLELGRTQITDAGLPALASLTALTSLDLYGTQITDAGLPALASLTALISLDLGRTQITDAGLPALASLTALTSLDLSDTQITDAGLLAPASLTALTWLGLSDTQITDAGLPALASLTALTSLGLMRTQITDAGLTTLSNLDRLTRLDLEGTQVSDSGLQTLASLRSLTWLDLSNTRASNEAVEELKKKRPKLSVGFLPRSES